MYDGMWRCYTLVFIQFDFDLVTDSDFLLVEVCIKNVQNTGGVRAWEIESLVTVPVFVARTCGR